MPRIIKEAEVRRQEIIEISRTLFEKYGYESTSVETIIKEANIAKGTFYYYFKSKKEILDEVVNTIFEDIYTLFKKIKESKSLSALDKLGQIFMGSDKASLVQKKVMKAIHRVENRALQEKLNISTIENIIPLITEIFNQGCAEGVWNKEISTQKMQIILGGAQFILDSGLFPWTTKERRSFLIEIQDLLEYTIGAAKGTFDTTFNALT